MGLNHLAARQTRNCVPSKTSAAPCPKSPLSIGDRFEPRLFVRNLPRAVRTRGFSRLDCSAWRRANEAYKRRLSSLGGHLNAPDFEAATGDTFKGVEVPLVALRLYSEQTHFSVALRAEEQRRDGRFRNRVSLCIWSNASHGMCAFPGCFALRFCFLRRQQLRRERRPRPLAANTAVLVH